VDDSEAGVLDGKDEVDEENDAGHDGQAAHGHAGGAASSVLEGLDGDGADGDEEDAADEVDEELQDGEVGAQQVRHQHGRRDDCKPDNGAGDEELVVSVGEGQGVPVAPAEPGQHQNNQHKDNFQNF